MENQTNQRRTAFIVDDDPAITASLSVLSEILDISVETFSSAIEFLEYAESHEQTASACLIVDVRMPNMDGFELLERLVEVGKQLPTIMMTGHGDADLKLRADGLGVIAFLEKPFRPERLEEILLRHFEEA